MLPRTIVSKDGREIILRHVTERDAEPLIRLLNAVFAEEAFMLRTVFTLTADEERAFIRTLRPPNLFIVADKNLRYQQNLKGRTLAILECWANHRPTLEKHFGKINNAAERNAPGEYIVLENPE